MAQDASQGVTMQVDAPVGSSCTAEDALRAAVEARLGEPVISGAGPAVKRLHVRFARASQGFDATLAVFDEKGTQIGARQLHSESPRCADLDAGLEFVIATLLRSPPVPEPPVTWVPEAPPPVAPEPAASEGPTDPPVEAREQATQSETSDRAKPGSRVRVWRNRGPNEPWKMAWAAGVLCERGLLPGAATGLSTGLQAGRGPFVLIGDALGFPYATAVLGEGASARFAAVFGRLALCGGAVDVLGGRASLCAGMRAGAVFLRTRGLDLTERVHTPTVQAEIGVRYEGLRARRVGFYLALRATMPIYAARPFYEGEGKRHYYADPGPGIGGEFGVIVRPRS